MRDGSEGAGEGGEDADDGTDDGQSGYVATEDLAPAPPPVTEENVGWFQRLKSGLTRSSTSIVKRPADFGLATIPVITAMTCLA